MTARSILNMANHETNDLFFDNLEIPEENLIGEEWQGFLGSPSTGLCRRPYSLASRQMGLQSVELVMLGYNAL